MQTLLLGGVLTVAAMAPKVVGLLRKEHIDAVVPTDPAQRLRETLSRLKRKRLITFEQKAGRPYPRLTPKGFERAHQVQWGECVVKKPLHWDGRWRIVIFDISQERRAVRDRLRGILKRLGFVQVQRSVWAHPYDCEELIALLKLDLRLRREVLYVIADAVEYDRPLRERFGLSGR